jgi:hypothetical protein
MKIKTSEFVNVQLLSLSLEGKNNFLSDLSVIAVLTLIAGELQIGNT